VQPQYYFYLIALTLVFGLVAASAAANTRLDKQPYEAAFLILASSTLFVCRWPALIVPYQLNPDEAAFAANALKTAADIIPWRGFDAGTSGPLNGYILAVPALFGAPINFFSTRITGVCLMATTMVAFYYAVKWRYGARVGRMSILPATLLLAFTGDLNFVHFSSEHLPIWLVTLPLAASAYIASNRGSKATQVTAAAVSGLCLGSAPFAKLQVAPIAVVTTIIAIAALLPLRRACYHWRTVATVFFLSLIAVPALLVSVLWLTGGLSDASISYILSALVYASGGFIPDSASAVGPSFFLYSSDIYPAFVACCLITVAVGFLTLLLTKRISAVGAIQLSLAVFLVVAAVYSIYKPHRPFEHYLLFLIIPLSCCVAVVLGLTRSAGLWTSREPSIGSVFAAWITLPVLAHAISSPNIYVKQLVANRMWQRPEQVRAIERYATRGEVVCVWGWAPEYYVHTGTVMATRDAETTRQIYPNFYREYFRNRFLADLRSSQAPVFVDAVAPGAFHLTDRAKQGHEVFAELAAYVGEHYSLREDIGGVRIYVTKSR
jgi:hypothetical protein